jgi:uncharacterized protein (TIGR02466 family)
MINIKKMNLATNLTTIVEPEISGIFPIPIYTSYMDRLFTSLEIKIFQNAEQKTIPNSGNITSTNNYILNEPGLESIRNILTAHTSEYIKRIVCPTDPITPYITQSWLNYTKEKEFHHSHEHPNSFISGVLYIDAADEHDKITFQKKGYQQIKTIPNEWNVYNSESWSYSVYTGKIILFPSSTPHMVENKGGDNTRISLAFNTFIKGTIGSNRGLTELIL